MRITELFTAQSIALDEALQTQEEILSRLVELQATHGNITDKDAYKKALYAREAEASTYVDNGITVPHARTACVTRPSLAALRLSTPVQYNADDDGKTDLLFAIAAPENGSLHIDMLARMMQMLMNDDFVEKLRAAKTPAEFLDAIDAQEDAQFGEESFTQQEIPRNGYRVLAVTACPNGIAHTYMAAEALTKMGDKLGLPTKVETNGSDGAKNVLTPEEIAACDGIIIAADKNVETARFDGKPVLFARVDDGIHKPEELIKKIAHGETPIYHAEAGAKTRQAAGGANDSFGHSLYKHLMNGVSHMLPFVVGGGIMIALAFLLDDYTIDPSNFGMNTPVAAFFKTVGSAAFGYMLPILAGFIAMSIADRPGLAVGFAGGVLAMNGTNFAALAHGETTGISGGFLAALLAGFAAGYIVQFLKKITEKLPASLNGIRPMLIYPLGGILIHALLQCTFEDVHREVECLVAVMQNFVVIPARCAASEVVLHDVDHCGHHLRLCPFPEQFDVQVFLAVVVLVALIEVEVLFVPFRDLPHQNRRVLLRVRCDGGAATEQKLPACQHRLSCYFCCRRRCNISCSSFESLPSVFSALVWRYGIYHSSALIYQGR